MRILLLCLLRGRLRRRRGNAPGFFQPFEISNLGAMVGVMTEHTTKSTRVDGFNINLPLAFVVIAPLGVLVPLVLVAPRGLVLWGMIPALTGIVYSYSSLPSCYCLLDEVGWQYSIIQNSDTVEQRKVGQNLPPYWDVGEP